ncbi:MAG: peptide-methionine (S)-S-oxide reductase MsrA [Candidatus Thorarchaeota archaeon]|nr:peptide-methionine (S)-S-oxide reductase MsrA [Candidatus Thorarchaeota archaeon]
MRCHESREVMEIAILGAGCFWCVEAVYRRLRGVKRVTPGYAGGHIDEPTYEEVSTGTTGHAEVCKIEFDPEEITFEEILEVFFVIHDPTTPNRQGNDIGPQYRSVIFYCDDRQREIAKRTVHRLTESRRYSEPIVTEIEPCKRFYPAEKYHHDYFTRNSRQPYCRFVIDPKVTKIAREFKHLVQE